MSTVEQLTTGWEQHAPVEDTLLRRYLFHNVALGQAFAVAAGGHALDSPDFGAADVRGPSGYWNAATLLRPPSDWAQVLDEVERFFATGTGEALLWSPWPTPDLHPRGWRLSGHPPLLARPPVDLAPLPAAGDVERVTTERGLVEWEQAAIAGYPLPELQPVSPGSLASPALLDDDRLAFYLGRTGDGATVSVSASFASHGIASLAFAATLPAARGQGHWHAHAVARLRANPSVWTLGVFSDFSRPLAERLGFVPLLRFTLWIRDRGARP
jgi:uncharacterized protein (DUF486 family)